MAHRAMFCYTFSEYYAIFCDILCAFWALENKRVFQTTRKTFRTSSNNTKLDLLYGVRYPKKENMQNSHAKCCQSTLLGLSNGLVK